MPYRFLYCHRADMMPLACAGVAAISPAFAFPRRRSRLAACRKCRRYTYFAAGRRLATLVAFAARPGGDSDNTRPPNAGSRAAG